MVAVILQLQRQVRSDLTHPQLKEWSLREERRCESETAAAELTVWQHERVVQEKAQAIVQLV
jgi:hypothetical protein